MQERVEQNRERTSEHINNSQYAVQVHGYATKIFKQVE